MNAPFAPAPSSSNATLSLILGIVGIVFCQLCAPFAWNIGLKAEREIDASGGTLDGRGLATAGKIMGIIGTVLLICLVLFFVVGIVMLGLLASSDPTIFDTTTEF